MKKNRSNFGRLPKIFQDLVTVDPANYRLILVKFFLLIGIPILAIFSISDLLRGATIEWLLTVIALVFFIFTIRIVKPSKRMPIIYRTGLGLLILNFIITIYVSLELSYSVFWTFLLPIPIFFLLGTREGSVWTIVSNAAYIIAILTSPLRNHVSSIFVFRYGFTIFVVSMLAFIVEVVRERVHSLLIAKQEELEELSKEYYENSIRDPLTGFYNRTFFFDSFEMIVSQAVRANIPIVAILMDLDEFKSINDQCGHLMGDQTLEQISEVIRSVFKRKSDFVMRYGGDEFLIVVFDTALENAKILVSKVIEGIGEIQLPNCYDKVQASFGMVEAVDLNNRKIDISQFITSLISIADQNMYRAKALGGNAIVDELKINL